METECLNPIKFAIEQTLISREKFERPQPSESKSTIGTPCIISTWGIYEIIKK